MIFRERKDNGMESNRLFLIVEDDRQIRSFIRVSLRTQNYRTIEAASGREAMNLIVSSHPDIIILDLGLPDMDGLTIIRQVRSFSDTPIIVVSARTMTARRWRHLTRAPTIT